MSLHNGLLKYIFINLNNLIKNTQSGLQVKGMLPPIWLIYVCPKRQSTQLFVERWSCV